jgi:hypothetical protein
VCAKSPYVVLHALLLGCMGTWGCSQGSQGPKIAESKVLKEVDIRAEFERSLIEKPLSVEEKKELERVETMIEQKKDLNFQEGEQGLSPLCMAAEKGYARVALSLLKHGADVTFRSKSGFAPLDFAASFCQVDLVDVLLFAGADPNSRQPEAQVTPLHGAALRGCREIVVKLLDHKADVNSLDKRGRSPLHYACSKNEVAAADALLRHGAKVNQANNDGNTPLHIAAGGYVKTLSRPQTTEAAGVKTTTVEQVNLECDGVVKLLLQNGAEVNVKNKAGQTPLAIADHPTDPFAQANPLTAELLKKYGAK